MTTHTSSLRKEEVEGERERGKGGGGRRKRVGIKK